MHLKYVIKMYNLLLLGGMWIKKYIVGTRTRRSLPPSPMSIVVLERRKKHVGPRVSYQV